MTVCKGWHNIKLLWRWLLQMGSHLRHWSANTWPAVTDSFNWGSICWVWCSGIQGIYAQGGSIHYRSMLHHYTSPCQSTIGPCYTIIPQKSAQGICALCYMWNLCGVVVFHGSMVNWRRGWGQSVIKLIWCKGFPDIYAQLGCVNLLWVYVHCAIYETHLV